MFDIIGLLAFTVLLLWLVMSAPVGIRTVRRRFAVPAGHHRVWRALYPFGEHYGWNGAVTWVTRTGEATGRMVTSHMSRDGSPIERDFEIFDELPGRSYSLRYTNDTSLAQSFWESHRMDISVAPHGDDMSMVEIAETDRYRGIAFLVFRFFALRRMAIKFRKWIVTGDFRPGGIFEHPATQIGMAAVSALLLWPIFGLTGQGLFLAVTLTVVVGVHELGHMAAFRLVGHRSARMIFLPLLGGIAMGGRPYDKHFEIGFAALMGSGFSVFPVAALMWFHMNAGDGMSPLESNALVTIVLIAALFNLGNLMPVWKFDGGQVLRQVFRSNKGMAAAAFSTLFVMTLTGRAAGLPWGVMAVCGAILAILSLMTAKTSVAPKSALVPMTGHERVAVAAGLCAVLAVHALAAIWGARVLF
jgi:Zn-dependent protease